jgi:glutathionylspermidine synthase
MKREDRLERPNWSHMVESLGFTFHSSGEVYWNERASYRFSTAEIDILEEATNELYTLACKAVDFVIEHNRLAEFGIPQTAWPLVRSSWQRGEVPLYGRFDLAFDGDSAPKLLEFNADTPTSLLEASVIQWQWKRDVEPASDQFNSIHEKLVARWPLIVSPERLLHLACCMDNDEDLRTVEYLADTAIDAGIVTKILDVSQISWSPTDNAFYDGEGRPIQYLFKLYPWEWLLQDEFAEHLAVCDTTFIEPAWKMVLSNKAILPILWELFPEHPNLLPAYWSPEALGTAAYVEKPIISREGSNVRIYENGGAVAATDGSYHQYPKVYQARASVPNFNGYHMMIGSWIIGDEAAGIGIREDCGLITTNSSPFIPHIFA